MIISLRLLAITSLTGYVEVGGFVELVRKYMGEGSQPILTRLCLSGLLNASLCTTAHCGLVPDNSMHMMRAASDPNYPWTGMIFGLTISAVWYWCTDQVGPVCGFGDQMLC